MPNAQKLNARKLNARKLDAQNPNEKKSPASLLALGLIAALAWLAPGMSPWSAASAHEDFSELAERLAPAVVSIQSEQEVRRASGRLPPPDLPEDHPYADLFRDFGEGTARRRFLGSGFIIDAAGYVVTNNHVVEEADQVRVVLVDGREFEADILGVDERTDLALLKFEPDGPLTTVPFGDSDDVKIGEWVLAIGNPFNFGGSVSAGIVSGRNRRLSPERFYDDFIQTDAAINTGNSGGPLFNQEGEVIGVNTAILSPSGGSVGVGFSIASNVVKEIVAQLRANGEVVRGWLGVNVQEINAERAESFQLSSTDGALVTRVTPGGPADLAGIQAGDVIIRFDGRPIIEMEELPRFVTGTQVGKTVDVDIIRDGQALTLTANVARLGESGGRLVGEIEQDPEPRLTGEPLDRLGVSLAQVTNSLREAFALGADVEGLVVTEVAENGAAAGVLLPGDVIVSIGPVSVSSFQDLVSELADLDNANKALARFYIQRGDEFRYEAVRLNRRGD